MSLFDYKQANTYGILASLRTLLNDYPVLIDNNEENGDTDISFMLSILKILGISDEEIFDFLGNLLADNDGKSGFLFVIEQAIKASILASLTETYSCAVDPTLPTYCMGDIHPGNESLEDIFQHGIIVPVSDIDAFGILSNCPTDEIGSLFYFDNSRASGYTPNNIFSSTDFNAYLWYAINRGSYGDVNEDVDKDTGEHEISGRVRCTWDNRVLARPIFKSDESMVGNPESGTAKYDFMHSYCGHTPIKITKKAGVKYEILSCEYKEGLSPKGDSSDYLIVRLNKDRYFRTGEYFRNKTLFEFNADYVSSLKLFDSKTLVAQIINALLGIISSFEFNMSIERMAISEYVRSIIENISESEDDESVSDCFYSFSNEEYDEMLKKAMDRYGKRYSGNEANNTDVLNSLYKIESSDNLNEEVTSIVNVFKTVTAVSDSEFNGENSKSSISVNFDILNRFFNETCIQIILQILSPKVMLLYAINDYIMTPEEERKFSGIKSFLKQFMNMIRKMVRDVYKIFIKWIFDFLMSSIKPLIVLFIQKLAIETLYYYKILLEQLFNYCSIAGFNIGLIGRNGFEIDSVGSADIRPVLETPTDVIDCRK